MGDVTIRRLRAEEWKRYRAIRLTALAEAPYAFNGILSEEERLPDEQWQVWARGTVSRPDAGSRSDPIVP